MIKPADKGKVNVVHCHGKKKGKPINKEPMSPEKGRRMHAAIEINKKKRGK